MLGYSNILTWNWICTIVLLFIHTTTVYFLLDQARRFARFWKYAVPIQSWERDAKQWIYFYKLGVLVLLIFVAGLQVGLQILGYTETSHDWETWFQLLIVFPVMLGKLVSEFRYKLSTENEVATEVDSVILNQLAMLARDPALLLGLLYGTESGNAKYSAAHWTNIVISILRPCCMSALLFLTILTRKWKNPSSEESNISQGSKDTQVPNSEEEKTFSPSAIWTKLYNFRTYFIPTEFLARVSLVALIACLFSDAWVDLYSSITFRRILDSLHISDVSGDISVLSPENTTSIPGQSNPDLNPIGAIRLEYRWDYLVIYALIQFSRYSVFGNFKRYLNKYIEDSCSCKLQMEIFSKLHDLSLRWHLENKSSDVFNLMSSGPSMLSHIMQSFSWIIPELLIMGVQIVYLVSRYNFQLSGVVVATAIISVILDVFVLRWRDKALSKLAKAKKDRTSSRGDSFENFETVKYFTNEQYEKEKHQKRYLVEKKEHFKTEVTYDASYALRAFLQGLAELGVILIVVRSIINEDGLTPGDYLYFSSIFHKILTPVESVLRFYKDLQRYAIDLDQLMDVLTLVPEIVDESDAPPLKLSSSCGGSIEFRNLDFAYTPDRQVISNINFVVPAGKTVALVGHSGCGKSTLAKLLFRFYDPTGGEILIDGQNIKKVQSKSLRRSIGVVPQDIVLFNTTIMKNIKYGDILNATDKDVESAAKLSALHEKIESFPEKYNTLVGSRGMKLSGGEKQRVAIARTIVKNPPIIILDEATSSLDTETERHIQASLTSLCQSRTCVVIAHRLSTIVNSDLIVVLKDGNVVESGTHGELIAKNDHYAKMWSQQFNSSPEVASDGANATISQEIMQHSAQDTCSLVPKLKRYSSDGNCSEVLENHSG